MDVWFSPRTVTLQQQDTREKRELKAEVGCELQMRTHYGEQVKRVNKNILLPKNKLQTCISRSNGKIYKCITSTTKSSTNYSNHHRSSPKPKHLQIKSTLNTHRTILILENSSLTISNSKIHTAEISPTHSSKMKTTTYPSAYKTSITTATLYALLEFQLKRDNTTLEVQAPNPTNLTQLQLQPRPSSNPTPTPLTQTASLKARTQAYRQAHEPKPTNKPISQNQYPTNQPDLQPTANIHPLEPHPNYTSSICPLFLPKIT